MALCLPNPFSVWLTESLVSSAKGVVLCIEEKAAGAPLDLSLQITGNATTCLLDVRKAWNRDDEVGAGTTDPGFGDGCTIYILSLYVYPSINPLHLNFQASIFRVLDVRDTTSQIHWQICMTTRIPTLGTPLNLPALACPTILCCTWRFRQEGIKVSNRDIGLVANKYGHLPTASNRVQTKAVNLFSAFWSRFIYSTKFHG